MATKESGDLGTDLPKLIEDGIIFFEKQTHLQTPIWLLTTLAWLMIVFVTLVALLAVLGAIVKLKTVWVDHFVPATYKAEQRARSKARRQFAGYLNSEIINRNRAENWRDEEFTELEAEVEAAGQWRARLPFLPHRSGLLREKSLTRALRRSAERLVLLEGDPGSGKSVALRHVAFDMSRDASHARSLHSKLPVYLNLKELKREEGEVVDRELIRRFALATLNRVNDRFVDEFIDREFDEGLKSGGWVFLFDSFDEIPEVLSSTEVDSVISSYSAAISDFLGGINACRGVVASRVYRGPAAAGWRAFRLLELSPKRQLELIRKSLVGKPERIPAMEAGLGTASDDVRVMARNPMLLGLLCEHVSLGHTFPDSSYEVFSKYLDYRLERDARRVRTRFGLEVGDIRRIAEIVAFSMTSDLSIGLSPRIASLADAIARSGFELAEEPLRQGLTALNYMRLGSTERSGGEEFTFAHRRFQEYFATRIVLQSERQVAARQLLTDARWRETAVVLLQTGSQEAIAPLFAAASGYCRLRTPLDRGAADPATAGQDGLAEYHWGPGQLHVLGILQAGAGTGGDRMPGSLRQEVSELIEEAVAKGSLLDRKLALEVAGAATEATLIDLMRSSLAVRSQWISDVVYRQASKLAQPVPEIYATIRQYIARMVLEGRMGREHRAAKAHLARLPKPELLLPYLTLGRLAWPVEALSVIAIAAMALWLINGEKHQIYKTNPLYFQLPLLGYMLSSLLSRLIINPGNYVICGFIRTFSALMLLLVIWFSGISDPVIKIFLTVILFIAATWAPAAIVCILSNQFRETYFWPFVSIGAALEGVKTIFRSKTLFLGILLVISGESLILFLLSTTGISEYMESKSSTRDFFGGAILALSILSAVWSVLNSTCRWAMDLRKIRVWRAAHADVLRPEDFEAFARSLQTVAGEVRLLKWLQTRAFEGSSPNWSVVIRRMLLKRDPVYDHLLFMLTMGPTGVHSRWSDWGRQLQARAKALTWRQRLAVGRMQLSGSGAVLERRDLMFALLERVRRVEEARAEPELMTS